MALPPNLCLQCNAKPRFVDSVMVHNYCGKTCAALAKATPAVPVTNTMCKACNVKPKFVDGIHDFPYCGKTCAAKAAKATPPPTGPMCSIPGCNQPVYVDPDGTTSLHCSQTHKRLASEACLLCKQAPKKALDHYCSRICHDKASKSGPIILDVPQGHITFNGVVAQFKKSWRHANKTSPDVRKVYKIVNSKATLDAYDAYKKKIEAAGNFTQIGRSPGNEQRRWHGTTRQCTLGETGLTNFCTNTACALCNIIKTSFDLRFFGNNTSWGRFGTGIYTSSTSSKSDDYSNKTTTMTTKAVLLNKVIVGKGCKLTQNNTALTAPPTGYDSVLGEVGGVLNYDELVVYTNDAILPSYLVLYDA